jgi:hypothetical protein
VRLVEHWLSHMEQTSANNVMLAAVEGEIVSMQLTQEFTAAEPAEFKIGQAHSVELHPNTFSIEPH